MDGAACRIARPAFVWYTASKAGRAGSTARKGVFPVNTRHLVYFLELSRQHNMNRAAEALFVSQSSLSQYLSRLEQEVGAPLFYRRKGQMTLTPAGQAYRAYAEQVLQLEQEMRQNIRSLCADPPLRVGVSSVWLNGLAAGAAARFHDRYPGTQIQLFDANHRRLKQQINEGSLDLALVATDSLDHVTGYQRVLGREEILFAVSRKNAALRQGPPLPARLTLAELAGRFGREPYILNKPDSSFRPLLEERFAGLGFRPTVSCEISNMTTVRAMVSRDAGVAFLPRSFADPAWGIAWFSLAPPLTRINAILCRVPPPLPEREAYFAALAEQLAEGSFPDKV